VHGRPTRSNYKTQKSEAGALASKVEDIISAGAANADETTKQVAEMAAQIKALTAAVTQLAATWNNWLGGNMFWPTVTRITIKQQDHPTWKGKSAPTNWQGLGIASRVKSNAKLFNIEQSLASNYYACLSPPPCQVKEHEYTRNSTTPAHKHNPLHQAHNNTMKKQDSIANMRDSVPTSWQYVIGEDDDLLWRGMENGTIPSMVVDSGCTLGVGMSDDPCWWTKHASKKKFVLPGSKIVNATEIAEYPFKVRAPAQELHITPGVTKNSLLSTSKFTNANYITIFDKEAVNIYDANETTITITRGVILRGFKCPMTGMWRIPLVDLVRNNNTDTVIVNCPPLEFLPARPPPADTIHNVYEFKTQPELVQYYHAATGFPTKPTWLKAIKNMNFASWPGLTADGVNRHYPDSEETPKGHVRKTPSGLRSTKVTTPALDNSAEDFWSRR
jgi:hypothetical protein